MKKAHSIMELIQRRTSTRTFDGRVCTPEHRLQLLECIDQINKEWEGSLRLVFIESAGDVEKQQLGTYGFISGARQYVAAVVKKEKVKALELGYLFEELILFATDLGLQTCWLGGTFDKAGFAREAKVTDQEIMPLVTPIGYKKAKLRAFEKAMRISIGADQRKPWKELFVSKDEGRSLEPSDVGTYESPLEMVRLGPSASNKQPWRILKEGDRYHFFLKRNKGYGVPGYDIQMNDVGIAKCHFEKTAQELGLEGQWQKADLRPEWDDLEYVTSWHIMER